MVVVSISTEQSLLKIGMSMFEKVFFWDGNVFFFGSASKQGVQGLEIILSFGMGHSLFGHSVVLFYQCIYRYNSMMLVFAASESS